MDIVRETLDRGDVSLADYLQYLDQDSIINLCMTNKRYNEDCKDPSVWREAIRRKFNIDYRGDDPRKEFFNNFNFPRGKPINSIDIIPFIPHGPCQIVLLDEDEQFYIKNWDFVRNLIDDYGIKENSGIVKLGKYTTKMNGDFKRLLNTPKYEEGKINFMDIIKYIPAFPGEYATIVNGDRTIKISREELINIIKTSNDIYVYRFNRYFPSVTFIRGEDQWDFPFTSELHNLIMEYFDFKTHHTNEYGKNMLEQYLEMSRIIPE